MKNDFQELHRVPSDTSQPVPESASNQEKKRPIEVMPVIDPPESHPGRISTSFSDRPLSQMSGALPITSVTIYFSPSTTPSGRQSG